VILKEATFSESSKMQIESVTHPGLYRPNNEDRCLVNALDNDHALLAIADGMGGHAAGEVAAQIAVECLEEFNPGAPDIIAEIINRIEQAQRAILERSRLDRSLMGMGTTLTALFLDGRSAFWTHVGDTRIYHLHEGSLTRITEDHTIPGMLFKKGEITREQARFHPYGNVLTRCLGCGEQHEPDSGAFDLREGDFVLLSSDGLHDLMADEQIAAILSAHTPLRDKLNEMVSICLEAGGKDNITAVITRI
jgi:PPM family protein phosphatase